MDWLNLLDSLGLYEHASFNQHIKAQRFLTGEPFVFDDDHFLIDTCQAAQFEFFKHAPLVDGFDQPRSFIAMHLYRCGDYHFRQASRLLKQWVHGIESKQERT